MTDLTMFTLTDVQGTAMSETVICSVCATPEKKAALWNREAVGPWSTTHNAELRCTECGRRGDTLDFAAEYQEEWEALEDVEEPVDFPHLDQMAPIEANLQRARFAALGLKAFSDRVGGNEDIPTVMSDLLCDLQHLADAIEADFDNVIDRARRSYQEEVMGE